MRVNYNVSAMIANNALLRNDTLLSESLERLSSGLKIANAKDNPSGLAMSRRMNSQIEGLGVAGNSANDAMSIVQVADGTLSEIHDILQRMNQLAVQACNDTLNDEDRELIQQEMHHLKEEVDRMATTTQFNGQNILDGSFDLKGYATVNSKTNPNIKVVGFSDAVDEGKYIIKGIDVSYAHVVGTTDEEKDAIYIENDSLENIHIYDENGEDYMTKGMQVTVHEDVLTLKDTTGKKIQIQIDENFSGNIELEVSKAGTMTMQIGANEGQKIDIRISKVNLTTLGLHNLDISNYIGAKEALSSIKEAIDEVSVIRSRLGAYQNRLEHTTSSIDVTVENMTAAYSRIMDVDMAEEMTIYSTQQVLSQAGTSMLAQANERPSQVLQLLQ